MTESLELVLRPSQMKTIASLLTSLGACGLGVWLISMDERAAAIVGWLALVFFGAGTAVFSLTLLPSAAYLKIDPEGFTTCSLFKATRMAWCDIDSFHVGRLGRSKLVTLRLASHVPASPLRRAAVALSGYDGALPNTYGMRAEELAALLNQCKRIAIGQIDPQAAEPRLPGAPS